MLAGLVRRLSPLLAFLVVLALAGCASSDGRDAAPPRAARVVGQAHSFDVKRVALGLVRPTWVGAAPGDPRALWVAEQPGRLLRLVPGRRTEIVLDLRAEVATSTEQGLLGVAFDPDFARSRRLFLHWSDRRGDTRVARFDLRTRRRRGLLHVVQPEEPNHKGGQLAVAPSGRLFVGLGDGGGAFDPDDNAQDPSSRLGKLLSLDPAATGPPRWRVELLGLRNPWRFSFDPALDEVWVGDVGQDAVEEIDRVVLEPDEGPKNLGWPRWEGSRALPGDRNLAEGELVFPVAAYGREEGCSVTGGLVYRGTALPRLNRRYLYGDFCTGSLWSLEPTPDGRARDLRRERATVGQLTHIGTGARDELVFASLAGELLRAVPPTRIRAPE